MFGTLYYKGIAGISSMQGMTRAFTSETVTQNLYQYMGSKAKEYLPHGVTINELLEQVEPSELEEVQKDLVYQMIRRKTFNDGRAFGKWLILVDGTELDEGFQQKNDYCKGCGWDYLIRYKEGCAPTILECYQTTPEKNTIQKAEYLNGIIFGDEDANVLKYSETKVKKGVAVVTKFAWITSIEITNKNAVKQ